MDVVTELQVELEDFEMNKGMKGAFVGEVTQLFKNDSGGVGTEILKDVRELSSRRIRLKSTF